MSIQTRFSIAPATDNYAVIRRGIPAFDTSFIPLLEGDVVLGSELAAQAHLEDAVLALARHKMDELLVEALLTGRVSF